MHQPVFVSSALTDAWRGTCIRDSAPAALCSVLTTLLSRRRTASHVALADDERLPV